MDSALHEQAALSRAAIPGPYDDSVRILSELAPPRAVRMSGWGKQMVFLFPGAFVASAGLITMAEHSHPTPGMSLMDWFRVGIVLLLVAGLVQSWIYKRDKRLVSQGALAIGRVSEEQRAMRGPKYVVYVFETPSGESISKTGSNYKADLFPGMEVPVFYDRTNPHRQVALCASFYEVVLP